jgi:hypothetical protein
VKSKNPSLTKPLVFFASDHLQKSRTGRLHNEHDGIPFPITDHGKFERILVSPLCTA